ncbi:MAG TPA: Fe-S protein assembly co-chaperone HscB [Caldimonas sp.]|jgi:molecular chaperone HscB|nr:Fe-S protein assembly co-chaperone HscB [Caldimonas sp.]HEX2540106.1 Fe-S protein assembly co-chaperone HscB [Caldimonas sp.]
MLLDVDDFELFGLPRRFALDGAELDARRRRLQAEVHPDRFAAADAASRRRAMQQAVRVNEGYERLRDPLRRAAYLCELNGAPIRAEDNTAMPEDFLVQQMAWRDALEEARGAAELHSVAAELDAYRADAYERLAATLDERRDFASAAAQVRALMFVERFADDVDERKAAEER